MEQIFRTIDNYPKAANIALGIMAALMAWAAFNYQFTTNF